MRNLTFLVFVVITFCCWGLYGPVLHIGQEVMGGGHGELSLLRPFICVGGAYFLIAVLFPIIVLFTRGETGGWTASGFIWSFAAGAIGAIGALGIILAFKFNGRPAYVMPLVFGLAPIVNTFVTMAMARTFRQASMLFYIAILIVAIGAAGVLIFKPKRAAPPIDNDMIATVDKLKQQIEAKNGTGDEAMDAESQEEATTAALLKSADATPIKGYPIWIAISVALTALCWGAYGPVLHRGQMKMAGSRLRPFICVGLAYFAIAVVVPLLLLNTFPDPGGWEHASGMLWSLGAGAVGAVGALGIIYAFNFGGKPILVMPLVFGFAPVINTLVTIVSKNLYGQISQYFYISLALVIFGAVMVLICAPRKAAPAAHPVAP